MSAPKSSFLSTDLLKETRTLQGSLVDATTRILSNLSGLPGAMAPQAPSPAEARALERMVLRYGGKVMEALEAAGDPLTDRRLFESVGEGTFPEFRQALAEMERRGLLTQVGTDKTFGDPCYRVVPAA